MKYLLFLHCRLHQYHKCMMQVFHFWLCLHLQLDVLVALCRPKTRNGPKLEMHRQFPLLGKPKTGNASAVSTFG